MWLQKYKDTAIGYRRYMKQTYPNPRCAPPFFLAQPRSRHHAAGLTNKVKKCSQSSRTAGLARTNVRIMTQNRIPNATRWQKHITALVQFVARTGTARVPASHTEVVDGQNIALGAWVGYMRQRNRSGLLSTERKEKLEQVQGWTWGPLRPGPATNTERDENILALRSEGISLEAIGTQFGISRQRVHQIAGCQGVDVNA